VHKDIYTGSDQTILCTVVNLSKLRFTQSLQ